MIGDDYQMLYDLERRAHRITRQKLEKAAHDRDRYRRRIRQEQAWREELLKQIKYAKIQAEIMKMYMETLERSTMHEPNPTPSREKSGSKAACVEENDHRGTESRAR